VFDFYMKTNLVFNIRGTLCLMMVGLVSVAEATVPPIPKGIFAMSSSDEILNDPRIVGVDVGDQWGDIEGTEGVYDWSAIDSQLVKAEAHGKKVLLRIVSGGVHVPDWLLANPDVHTFRFIDPNSGLEVTMPVFWDPIFLAKKIALIQAAGAHFAAHSSIQVVTCSFANAITGDWNIPDAPADIVNWRAAGYTTELMVNAGQMVIDATMAAFPNQNVALSIGSVAGDLDPTPAYLSRTVVDYATTTHGRFITEKNSLAATTVDPPFDTSLGNWQVLFDQYPHVAAQMLWAVSGDTTYQMNGGIPGNEQTILLNAITIGAHYGTQYQEIYKADLEDPAMSSVIDAANILLTVSPVSQLLNISTRLRVETGDNVLIGGFIITGTEAKTVLVRGIGPSLSAFGLTGALADPTLELHEADGTVVTNDNWRDTQQQEISATMIPPSNDLESAIIATLAPGAHTAILRGNNGGTGVGLVEVYDLAQAAASKLANISTRGFVQTGDNVMIGGIIILGIAPQNVLLRALGPSLPLTGTLADPMLELHDKDGVTIATNDNWRSDQEAEITATTISPTNDAESAILMTLTPDAYTAVVRGIDNTTGIALVEAYQLDN
jgi:hypothetical protein